MREVDMNDKCVFCGNKNIEKKKVQYIYSFNSEYIIVNNVPCEVCSFCGEKYFGGKQLERIEKLFFDIKEKKRSIQRMIEVPIEEYEDFIA